MKNHIQVVYRKFSDELKHDGRSVGKSECVRREGVPGHWLPVCSIEHANGTVTELIPSEGCELAYVASGASLKATA